MATTHRPLPRLRHPVAFGLLAGALRGERALAILRLQSGGIQRRLAETEAGTALHAAGQLAAAGDNRQQRLRRILAGGLQASDTSPNGERGGDGGADATGHQRGPRAAGPPGGTHRRPLGGGGRRAVARLDGMAPADWRPTDDGDARPVLLRYPVVRP